MYFSGVDEPAFRIFQYELVCLLALIIEKVSGLPYPEFMTKTFFRALADAGHLCLYDCGFRQSRWPPFTRAAGLSGWSSSILYTATKISTAPSGISTNGIRRCVTGSSSTKGVLDSAYAGYSFEKPGQRNYGLGWRMLFIPNGKKADLS